MSNYGLPCMGSKAKICEDVCLLFPKADHFYDLFGGGFSITHFMLKHRSKDFKEFHFNEIRSGIPQLIQDAISGKYSYANYSPPWVSREDFEEKKEIDPMIKIIWSFGNNGKSYLFGKDIEQQKKSLHMAIVFNEFDDFAKEIFSIDSFKEGYSINQKRLYLKNCLSRTKGNRVDLQRLERLQQLQQLEQLQRLQQLEQLQRLERLQQLFFYNTSYERVQIKENSIIYCDIPYIGTCDYGNSFNHKKFYEWASDQKSPVFISEYRLDDSRFKCIANFKKRSMINSNKESTLIKTEKVFINDVGYRKLMSRGNP